MEEVIRLENVVRMDADNRRILGGVSLNVQKGERVRILGPPGSGENGIGTADRGDGPPQFRRCLRVGQACAWNE